MENPVNNISFVQILRTLIHCFVLLYVIPYNNNIILTPRTTRIVDLIVGSILPVRDVSRCSSRARLADVRIGSELECLQLAASNTIVIALKVNRCPAGATHLVRESSFLRSASLILVDSQIVHSSTFSSVSKSHRYIH